MAAFFGLSDTRKVLRECGLSGFADERVVTLEPLPDEDATCAIRSVFDACGFTGVPEDREVWVNELAELSQGWPQHINRVAVAAVRLIRNNGGRIGGALLERLLDYPGAQQIMGIECSNNPILPVQNKRSIMACNPCCAW